MVVGSAQNFLQIGLRIRARVIGNSYYGNCLGECFATSVSVSEERVLSSYPDWTGSLFGGNIVAHVAAVFKLQGKTDLAD